MVQVPQYILDHMWGQGKVCKAVCTQPRRISAISGVKLFSNLIIVISFIYNIEMLILFSLLLYLVAERIANERGGTIGEDIGYKVISLNIFVNECTSSFSSEFVNC